MSGYKNEIFFLACMNLFLSLLTTGISDTESLLNNLSSSPPNPAFVFVYLHQNSLLLCIADSQLSHKGCLATTSPTDPMRWPALSQLPRATMSHVCSNALTPEQWSSPHRLWWQSRAPYSALFRRGALWNRQAQPGWGIPLVPTAPRAMVAPWGWEAMGAHRGLGASLVWEAMGVTEVPWAMGVTGDPWAWRVPLALGGTGAIWVPMLWGAMGAPWAWGVPLVLGAAGVMGAPLVWGTVEATGAHLGIAIL